MKPFPPLPAAAAKAAACDAYVRVYVGTKIPVGIMADHKLRALRRSAHRSFDQLHESGLMSKEDAYRWLADLICVPLAHAHIGHLGEYYCQQVIEQSNELLKRRTAIANRAAEARGGEGICA